jgi:hypothetical protein
MGRYVTPERLFLAAYLAALPLTAVWPWRTVPAPVLLVAVGLLGVLAGFLYGRAREIERAERTPDPD